MKSAAWRMIFGGVVLIGLVMFVACGSPQTVAPTLTPKPTMTAVATSTSEPTATYTPQPTATSTPQPTNTSTPSPTDTPPPTSTPTPVPTDTPTPKPTQTPTPRPTATLTPRPTPTPRPSLEAIRCSDVARQLSKRLASKSSHRIADITLVEETSRSSSRLLCKGLIHIVDGPVQPLMFSQDNTGGMKWFRVPLDEYECAYLVPVTIKLSEERMQSTSRPTILKIYEPKELRSNSEEFVCVGRAKWSRGKDTYIEFYIQEDQDQDRFNGFSPTSAPTLRPTPKPTATATLNVIKVPTLSPPTSPSSHSCEESLGPVSGTITIKTQFIAKCKTKDAKHYIRHYTLTAEGGASLHVGALARSSEEYMWLTLFSGVGTGKRIIDGTVIVSSGPDPHVKPVQEPAASRVVGPGPHTVLVMTDFIRRKGNFELVVWSQPLPPTPTPIPISGTCDKDLGILSEGVTIRGRFVIERRRAVSIDNEWCTWSRDSKATISGYDKGAYFAFQLKEASRIAINLWSDRAARLDLLHEKGRYGSFVKRVFCTPASDCRNNTSVTMHSGESEVAAILEPGDYTIAASFGSGFLSGRDWDDFRILITRSAP